MVIVAKPKTRLSGWTILFRATVSFLILSLCYLTLDNTSMTFMEEREAEPKIEMPCAYKSIKDLSKSERYPKATETPDENNQRHMVTPPKDGKISLVCCETTAGNLSIAVHSNWAPLGAEQFLDMVHTNYFSSKVALMRCIHNFLCQFGIAGVFYFDFHCRLHSRD